MTGYTIRARPTTYKGIQMRSRLEAQFAALLDRRGLTWEYEPQCFADEATQYLPDFKVGTGRWCTFVEVKPTFDHATGALQLMHVILSSMPDAQLEVWVPDAEGEFHVADQCTSELTLNRRRVRPLLSPSGTCRCSRDRSPGLVSTAIISHHGYMDHLHCMRCGDEYTHLENVRTYKGGSDGGRYTAALEFRCEQGCTFAVEINNHKGYTMLVETDCTLPPLPEDDGDAIA